MNLSKKLRETAISMLKDEAKRKQQKNVLPINVEDYVNRSVLFNKFGLINLNALRSYTKTELSNEELKMLINERFASEIVRGKIEFIEK